MSRLKNKILTGESLKTLTKRGIYRIHHIKKPNVYYIGSSSRTTGSCDSKKGLYRRFLEHIHFLEKQKHTSIYLQNVVNKYGIEGLRFEILELTESTDRDYILKREQYYIDLMKPMYNISLTASCPTVPYTYERRKAASDRMKGKSLSIEVYEKIRVKVSAYKKDGELYKSFLSIKEASQDVNIDRSLISRCLSGEKKTAAGYFWKRT